MQFFKYLSICQFNFLRCQMEILSEKMKIIDVTEYVIRNQNFELICRQEKVLLFFRVLRLEKKCHLVMECDVT